jgi:hypothetical protein
VTVAVDPTEPNDTLDWLQHLYAGMSDGWLTLFAVDRTTGDRMTKWRRTDDLEGLAADAGEIAPRCCVWFGVATRTERVVGKRGGAEHCGEVPALWLDIDVADAVHASDQLPPDYPSAMELLHRFPVTPTAIVASGHGLQAWWVLDEPATADEVTGVLARWNVTWDRLAYPWHVDNVFDLPRIMRLPGTFNRKSEPVAVEIIDADWDRRYGLSDLAEQMDDLPPPVERPASSWSGDEGLPGQVFNQRHDGHEVLRRLGFTEHHTDSEGVHYTRPGKDVKGGSSATVYDDDGHTTIWSDSVTAWWPALEVRRPYDPFGLYAATMHGGDFGRAAAELERTGYGTLGVSELDLEGLIATPEPKADEPPKLLSIRWVDSYLTDPPPDPDPIIEGLLNAGEFMVIGAERGIGKTWLGYNIASLLTTGDGALFGRLPVPQPRRVLYLQGELDETQANIRWRLLHGVDGLDALAGGGTATLPHLAESFDQVRLRAVNRRSTIKIEGEVVTDEYVDASIDRALEATIEAMSIDVVVIDPWAVFFAGNESSNDQVEAVLQELRHLGMRRRVAWVILHHFGKNRETAEPEDLWRGASRLADWAANRVTIARYYTDRQASEAGMARRDARRYAQLHFLRRGAPLDEFCVHLEEDGWWQEWTPGDGELGPRTGITDADVLDKLREVGEFTSYAHAADLLGTSDKTVKRYLNHLCAEGWIQSEKGVNHGWRFWIEEAE